MIFDVATSSYGKVELKILKEILTIRNTFASTLRDNYVSTFLSSLPFWQFLRCRVFLQHAYTQIGTSKCKALAINDQTEQSSQPSLNCFSVTYNITHTHALAQDCLKSAQLCMSAVFSLRLMDMVQCYFCSESYSISTLQVNGTKTVIVTQRMSHLHSLN